MVKILAVDDDEVCRDTLKLVIDLIGYNINIVSSGYEFLAELELSEEGYDIFIIDLMMPHPNGLELISLLKNNSQNKNIPIIVQSGVYPSQDSNYFIEKGILSSYLQKPYDKSDLLEAIQQALTENKNIIPAKSNIEASIYNKEGSNEKEFRGSFNRNVLGD